MQPHPHATTARLDLIDLLDHTGDRPRQRFVRKDLSGRHDGDRRAMPRMLRDAEREPWVYQHVLEPLGRGPRALGRWRTPTADWLLLEHVDGVQLRYTDDVAAWSAAGRWLGQFHASVDVRTIRRGPLLRVDDDWFEGWWHRARERHRGGQHELLLVRTAIDRCTELLDDGGMMPVTMLHGDFHPANLLLRGSEIVPVDWELAAIGDPAHDLGCLVSGDLPATLHEAVLAGYAEGRPGLSRRGLALSVSRARLRLCIQWLGWSDLPDWRPPAGQRTAWLAHGQQLARRVLEAAER